MNMGAHSNGNRGPKPFLPIRYTPGRRSSCRPGLHTRPGHCAAAAGVLSRVGTDGQMFTISYSPLEYGKVVRGTLIVLTDEMQWSYDVRGSHPKYSAPRGQTQVETTLDPRVTRQLGQPTQKKNFLRANMGR